MKKLVAVLAIVMSLFVAAPAIAGSAADADATAVAAPVAVSGAGVTNANDYSQTFEAEENLRPLPNGMTTPFPQIPAFFGPDTPGPTYQKVEFILPLKSVYERWEVDPSVSETDIMYRCRYFMKTDKDANDMKDKVFVTTMLPNGKFKMVAHLTLWAEDTYTTSFELMMKACQLAMDLPGKEHTVLITSQGCEKVVQTSGYGIGLATTRATINSNQDVGGVAVGGLGYASGEAGNKGKPWLQVAVLDVE